MPSSCFTYFRLPFWARAVISESKSLTEPNQSTEKPMNSTTLNTKLVAFLAATSILTASAFAQMGHDVPKSAKHVITCPVTGDKLDVDKATKSKMYADYKGNRYFFCCKDCPAMFKKNPAKYAAKPHVKVLGGKKHHG